MNTAGISTAPPPAVAPVVTPIVPTERTATDSRERESRDEERHRDQLRRDAIEVSKMRPLSTTEVRVLLGMAPVDALRTETAERARNALRGGFDDYL